MTETEFFVCTVAKRFDLILIQNEVAVWTEKVVGHQIGIVRRSEDLARQSKESFADFKRKLEMIEGIKLVNKNESCIPHAVHPEVQQFKMLRTRGGDEVKGYLFFVNKAKQILVPRVRGGKLEILTADVQKEPSEIIN